MAMTPCDLANRVAIDHVGKVLSSKYKVRGSHRLKGSSGFEQNRCLGRESRTQIRSDQARHTTRRTDLEVTRVF